MYLALAAVLGAVIALTIRELVEHRERIKTRQANCLHDFRSIGGSYGTYNLRCHKCGRQEFQPKDDT